MKILLVLLMSTLFLVASVCTLSHPTGNMIHNGQYLIWSYVCPIESIDHRACLMIWDPKNGVRPWLISAHPSSDWISAPTKDGSLILVERYYNTAQENHMYRLIQATPPNSNIKVIHDWKKDTHRFGEGGFLPVPQDTFLFAHYPTVYIQKIDKAPIPWTLWQGKGVKRIHPLGSSQFLALSDETVWLLNTSGKVLNQWNALLDKSLKDLPFLGNQIFDATLYKGDLWLAYWGGRKLEQISENSRKTHIQFQKPFLPHAITTNANALFILASSLEPRPNIRISPKLYKIEDNKPVVIWEANN